MKSRFLFENQRWLLRICFMIVLFITMGFRFWNLFGNDFGNLYYAAAVRSMASSLHNFLYAAFDPSGFLMLDKPPVAFWLQALSVKLFSYNGFSLHLPQVLEGILVVVLVYILARRAAGEWAALLAALVMSITPASVAIDRSNLPDSCLLLVLLLAAWMLFRAVDTGRLKWLMLSMVSVGIAFNIKMIVAFGVLPAFYIVYLVSSPVPWQSRLKQLSISTILLLVVSLSWPLFVDLTPTQSRPYVGDTKDNSALSLTFGMLGFKRFAGSSQPPPKMPGPDRMRPELKEGILTGHGGHPGLFRIANRDLAGHITWLIPFAIIGVIAAMFHSHWRLSTSPLHQSILLWGVWFATYAVVFSLSHSPIHPYYMTMLAPPIAIMVGIGFITLWEAFKRGHRWLIFPVAAIGLTALWQLYVLMYYPGWIRWLSLILLMGSGLAVIGLLAARIVTPQHALTISIGAISLSIGISILLVCSAIWSLTPVLAPGGRMVPIADPILLEQKMKPSLAYDNQSAINKLIEFLRMHRYNEKFLLAAPDVHLLAPIIIETGEPVMAYGGFSGSDPILTKDKFANMIEAGELRFVMLPDGPSLGRMGPSLEDQIGNWVREHGRKVPPNLWRVAPVPMDKYERPFAPWGETSEMIRHIFLSPSINLYDCCQSPDSSF